MANPQASNVVAMPATKPEAKGAEFQISAVISGFPVNVKMEGRADDLKALVEKLKSIGAEPPAATAPASAVEAKPEIPTCPVHNKPMKASSHKGGGFFCSQKLQGGEYCDQRTK